jgi:hypothetical protein
VGASNVDDSFGEVGVVFESDLIAPGTCAVDDVVAGDGVEFAGESVFEDDAFDVVGVFVFDEINEFGLVKGVGFFP